MVIKCLVENNSTNKNKFLCEHGLSLLIKTENHKILFDMGQTDAFIKNAEKMNENLIDVDIAVLSHGHYDHGGGLKYFIEKNKKAPVYVHKQAFQQYFNGKEKYIGLSEKLDKSSFIFVEDNIKIDENISIINFDKTALKYKINSYGLNKKVDGKFISDDFCHEQYLVIKENSKKIVISGCSHKGVLNILNYVKPDVFVGGFHFKKVDINSLDGRNTLDFNAREMLKENCRYVTCHCTGNEQYEYLKKIMKDRLNYIKSGDEITI